MCVCVCVVGVGGVERDGRDDSLISNSVCVGGGGGGRVEGGWKGMGKAIHLFQTALKNLANKYFYSGLNLIGDLLCVRMFFVVVFLI